MNEEDHGANRHSSALVGRIPPPNRRPRGHAPGKNAHRILVLGSGAHEDLTAVTALTTTEGRDLWKYDGIVVALGVIDSIMLTSPTISILWAALILREQLTWQTIIGGIAVIFCAGIAVRTRLNRTPPPSLHSAIERLCRMYSPDIFELIAGPPALDEYLGLRKGVDLSQKSAEQGEAALTGSWFFCHVRDRETGLAVAMGRIIGDGGWYFHIADMATLPEFQGRGLGRKVIDTLVAQIRDRAPDNPYITLIADPPGWRLYEQTGFTEIDPSRGMELPWMRW